MYLVAVRLEYWILLRRLNVMKEDETLRTFVPGVCVARNYSVNLLRPPLFTII